MILRRKPAPRPMTKVRTALNGLLTEDADSVVASAEAMRTATTKAPTAQELNGLVFASILVKHTKSNAIVLAKNNQLLASGTGHRQGRQIQLRPARRGDGQRCLLPFS